MARTKAEASNQVKGVLPVTDGGTNVATLPINELMVGNGTGSVLAIAPGTSGNVLTSNGTSFVSATAPASRTFGYFIS